jgi:hypothetical protein
LLNLNRSDCCSATDTGPALIPAGCRLLALGNSADQALLAALRQQHIPATLFLNSRWITANQALAKELAADSLFELANHGASHGPLSVTGRSAYGIPGTRNPGEVYDEIMTKRCRPHGADRKAAPLI